MHAVHVLVFVGLLVSRVTATSRRAKGLSGTYEVYDPIVTHSWVVKSGESDLKYNHDSSIAEFLLMVSSIASLREIRTEKDREGLQRSRAKLAPRLAKRNVRIPDGIPGRIS